jgi:hypothetical protein
MKIAVNALFFSLTKSKYLAGLSWGHNIIWDNLPFFIKQIIYRFSYVYSPTLVLWT